MKIILPITLKINFYLFIFSLLISFSNGYSQGQDINIRGNAITISNNDTTPNLSDNTDFGSSILGGNIVKTFEIENTYPNGNPSKNILTINSITVSGTNANEFVVNSSITSIARNSSSSFNITFTPLSSGLRSATVTILSNDPDESPYTFTIQGTGVIPTPEINVTDNSDSSILNGGSFNFGTVAPNSTASETFKIKNTVANTTLTLSSSPIVSISGDSEFSITAQPLSNTVAGNSFVTYSIAYNPTVIGQSHSATISIANNDPDDNENPYIITLQGICNNITYTPITDGPDWTVSNLTPNFELDNPNTIVYGPDNNLWITERLGRKVVKVDPTFGGNKTVMLDLTGVATATSGSQDGLMGMAVHPDLYNDINTSNNFVYLAYTYSSGGLKLRIARYTYNAGTGLLDSGSGTTILEGFDASNDHNS